MHVSSIGRLRYLDVPARGQDRVRVRGTLVLLHAFPLTADMWKPQLDLAERGWRIIAPYLGGMGGGEPPVSLSMDDLAGEVIDVLDGLHIHEAVICGLSMGGYVAFAMFRRAPRYFQGIVLADTRPQADTPEGVEGRKRMLSFLRENGALAVAEDMLPKLLGETTRRERPEIVERVRALAGTNSVEAVAGAINALMTRPDSTDVLASIQCPALILVGEEDTITPRSDAESMHRAIRGSELTVISRAGHLANLEQPREFNAALGRFLDTRV